MESKVIFTGPVGAGKTTAIAALSDIAPVKTDAGATDMTLGQKSSHQTTVAMDYGLINLDDGSKVHLFGTPGQERFDFMWDILTQGGLGLILLIDNSRPDPFRDTRFFLDAFKDFLVRVPLVVGVTKMDMRHSPDLGEHLDCIERHGHAAVPVYEVDGRRTDDVKMLLMTLLYYLDPGIGPSD
jgi:signal recognition particle receptor subunit beta